MNFDFEKKSLFTGIIAGFGIATIIVVISCLIIKNNKLSINNQKLSQNLKSINDAPLIKVKENKFDEHSEIIYEEPQTEHIAEDKNYDNETNPQTNKDVPLYIKNKQNFTIDPTKKHIAIVIDDVGVNVEHSKVSAEKLPVEVTFSYLPYGNATQELIKQEFNKHREALLHLPTEPISSINPGPNALYANMTQEKIAEITEYNINQLQDYIVGANNHMGSKFTANLKAMEAVLKVMAERKLFFIDSFTTAKTKVKIANDNVSPKSPILIRDIFLDHERTDDFIKSQLEKVEKIADKKGYAIAIGHPHTITTKNLVEWIKNLDTSKYQLVPITSILQITKQVK